MERWLFLIMFGCVGAFLMSFGVHEFRYRSDLKTNGVRVVGRYMGPDQDRYPEFEFRTLDGRTIHFTGRIRGDVKPAELGAEVEIFYSALNPQDAIVNIGIDVYGPAIIFGFGVLLLCAGIGGFRAFSDPFFRSKKFGRRDRLL